MASSTHAKSQVPALRGRPFEKGNPGRTPGSKNQSSQILAALLEGDEVELMRKAVEIAKAGDIQMLKFLLSRMLPRDRPIKIDLPQMNSANDAVEALGRITRAVSEGIITPIEAAALASLVNSYARAIDLAEVVKRMDALEGKMRGEVTA